MSWQLFDKGKTLGQRGSEDGIILRDEEHELGSRVTLEQNCADNIPYAVTCGIYGWFFHTRFLSSETEAEFTAMQDSLFAILELIPSTEIPENDSTIVKVSAAIAAFVKRFP